MDINGEEVSRIYDSYVDTWAFSHNGRYLAYVPPDTENEIVVLELRSQETIHLDATPSRETVTALERHRRPSAFGRWQPQQPYLGAFYPVRQPGAGDSGKRDIAGDDAAAASKKSTLGNGRCLFPPAIPQT